MEIVIDSYRGEQFTMTGAITKNGDGYPVTVSPGTELVFVAKRSPNDAEPVIRHDLTDGINLANGGIYSIVVVAADTEDFVRAELLSWALWLIEPGTDGVVVAEGRWRVGTTPGP